VTVTTPGGTSDPVEFAYVDAPVLTALDPTSGPLSGGTEVTITGTGFTADSVVEIGGVVVEAELIGDDLVFTTPAGTTAGPVDVTVTDVGGESEALEFTYIAAPSVTGIAPDFGPVEGGTEVTVTGEGFIPGTTVSVDGGDPITPISISEDGTTLVFITPPSEAGTVDVVVTTPIGSSDPVEFTYLDLGGVSVIVGLSPDFGPTTGGTEVTIEGFGFTEDSIVTIEGADDVTPDSVNEDGTELVFTTPPREVGPAEVAVVNDEGTSAPQIFTYIEDGDEPGTPTITGLDPVAGPDSGGTAVTVFGFDFTSDATVSVDGGEPIDPITIAEDGSSLVFVTPPHAAGPVDVVVTTVAGTSEPQTFTYLAEAATAATIDGLVPSRGPAAGGTEVTITGSGFEDFSVVRIEGIDLPVVPDEVSADGTRLVFTTPAHVPGTVDVRVDNAGALSGVRAFEYYAAAAVITDPAEGDTITDDTPTISGDGEPGATVEIVVDGEVVCTTTVNEDGRFSCTLENPLGVGDHTIVAVQSGPDWTSDPSEAIGITIAGEGDLGVDGPGGSVDGDGDGTGSDGSNGRPTGLPSTGSDPAGAIGIALMLLLGGAAMVAMRRRRRA